ncbi:MAG: ABC transporter permease [Microbacteriaceae bacterium]|nr:ABC transporter permease [Microbacteriaceae bacterium]
MSAFGIVLRFEVARALRKKAFWIGALALPVIIGVIGLVQFLGAQSAQQAAEEQAKAGFEFVYLDASGVVDARLATELGGAPAADADSAIAQVRSGETEAFFDFPADPSTQPVTIAGRHVGVIDDGRYGAVATTLLAESAKTEIGSPELVAIVAGGVRTDVTTYLPDGSVSTAAQSLPVGILLLALLFLTVVLLGQQVLIVTTEEKENRVAEILLTTTRPNAVIAAKLVALAIAGVVQMLVVFVPVAIGWALFGGGLSIAGLDLSQVVFDPQQILLGVLILLGAAALFIVTLAAVGASAPSAKEAGGFSALSIILPLAPLYAAAIIVTQPSLPIVRVLTYFPFTAGTTSLLRNAFGTLPLVEGLLVAAILFVSAALVLRIAVRAFRRGALEYDRMLGWRDLLGRPAR